MTLTIFQNKALIIFLWAFASNNCISMQLPTINGPHKQNKEGPCWHRKTLLYTSDQKLEMKTQTLLDCKSLLPDIEQGNYAIPLSGIPSHQLLHVSACLYAMHTSLYAQEESAQENARKQLELQTNTPHKLHTALMAANYLYHEELLDWCQNRWSRSKYSPHNDLALPMELDVEIGGRIVERTPLFRDIPTWLGQETWLNPQRTIRNTQGSVWCVTSNSTGSQIAIGDWLGNIQVFGQDNEQPIIEIPAHQNAIATIAFSNDNNQVISCAQDGTIRFWDIATGTLYSEMRCNHDRAPFVFRAHMPTHQFAYDEDSEIIVCNAETEVEKTLVGHTGPLRDIAFNPTGTLLASGGNDCVLKLWDLATGACIASLTPHAKSISCVQFSPDGTLLASGSKDRTIAVHDVFSQELAAILIGHSDGIWSLFISPDNQFVYSGGCDGSVKIWHLPSRTLIKNLVPQHRSSIQSMTLQPQGILVTAAHSGSVQFWNIHTLIQPIMALQRFIKRNSTIDQALLIEDAYQAPQREPLDCSSKRDRGKIFASLHPKIQKMLLKHLHVKPPKKKQKAQKSKKRSPTPSVSNKQLPRKDSHYSRK